MNKVVDNTGLLPQSIPRFQLLAVVAVTLREGWMYPEHVHEDIWQILFLREGAAEAVVDGVVHRATNGELLLYRAGARHAEKLVSKGPVRAVHIGFRAMGNLSGATWPVHSRDLGGHAARLIDWMLERNSLKDEGAASFLNAQIDLLMSELENPTRRDSLVDRVRHYAMTRLDEPLLLKSLAAAVGMSHFHFARKFREASGTSPAKFVRSLRVEAARALVSETQLPLKEIAAQTGFSDEFHLSKVFRQELGSPPSRWRRTR